MAAHSHLEYLIAQAGIRSHGIVSRSQLISIGCSEDQIDYRLRRGTHWPVFTSAYSIGGPARSWRAVWLAAVLSSGGGTVLAGRSAASLWRLTDQRPRAIEVNRGSGHNRRELTSAESGWVIEKKVRVRSNLPCQPAFVDEIPVLPVPELLVDLAGEVNAGEMEKLVSAASQKKHLDEGTVARVLSQGRGRKGIQLLRDELRFWDPATRQALSVLETRFIKICREHGIEMPRTNEWVLGLMVDFVWLQKKVVVEVDGFTYHGDRKAFERDHERSAVLLRGGYMRLTFTWRQVAEKPDEVVDTVLAALNTWVA